MIKFKLFFLAFSVLVISGCASFSQKEIPVVTEMPKVAQFTTKPNVFVDLKLYRGEPLALNSIDVTSQVPTLKSMVSKVFDENELFSAYTFDPFEKDKADYTIELHIYNHGNTGGAAISGFLSGFTLGVIPGAATDNYTLRSAVIGKNGEKLAEDSTKDSVTTWVGIWFIPAAGNTPQKAFDETVSNLIKDSLKKMIENKQLKYASLYRKSY